MGRRPQTQCYPESSTAAADHHCSQPHPAAKRSSCPRRGAPRGKRMRRPLREAAHLPTVSYAICDSYRAKTRPRLCRRNICEMREGRSWWELVVGGAPGVGQASSSKIDYFRVWGRSSGPCEDTPSRIILRLEPDVLGIVPTGSGRPAARQTQFSPCSLTPPYQRPRRQPCKTCVHVHVSSFPKAHSFTPRYASP